MGRKRRQKVCEAFSQGGCRFGEKCWWAHESGLAGLASAAAPPAAANGAGGADGGGDDPAGGASEARAEIVRLNTELMAAFARREAEMASEVQQLAERLSLARSREARVQAEFMEADAKRIKAEETAAARIQEAEAKRKKAGEAAAAMIQEAEAKRIKAEEAAVARIQETEAKRIKAEEAAAARIQEAEAKRIKAEEAAAARIQELESQVDKLRVDRGLLSEEVAQLRSRVAHLEANATPYAKHAVSGLLAVAGGPEWQFESSPGEWTGFAADRNAELLQHYQDFAKGGARTVSMKVGFGSHTFDLGSMVQTNTGTGTKRRIRCNLNTPEGWTRCTSLEHIFKAASGKRMELSGFWDCRIDGVYIESLVDEFDGHPVWWKDTGNLIMVVHWGTLHVVPVDEHYSSLASLDAVFLEQHSLATLRGRTDPLQVQGATWRGRGFFCTGVRVTALPESPIPGLMDIAVEVADQSIKHRLESLMRDSVVHSGARNGASECTEFSNRMKVVRVLRIENWHLWSKYCTRRQEIRRDIAKYDIHVDDNGLELPQVVSSFEAAQGRPDASIGEHLLFHGTQFETAVQIAMEGFDFRTSKTGYYGRGTYFASQACKSHQYNTKDGRIRTLILSRVVLGDYWVAQKVDMNCTRPPKRERTPRCFDSIVAKPGPMPGHQQSVQAHQEFVIFGQWQAYPEFMIHYIMDP